MTAIIALLIIILMSLILVRIATVVLVLTGLSEQSARFQAWSAFTGVGFTTHESENILNHPLRRQIAIVLMVGGNAAFITVITSLILSFLHEGQESPHLIHRLAVFAAGLLILWVVSVSQWVDRRLQRLVKRALHRWADLDMRDYASLLHLADNHEIMEIAVRDEDWVANKSLAELALAEEGVIVVGIQRANGVYVGSPLGRTLIKPGDTLLAYGLDAMLRNLDRRPRGPAGDSSHKKAAEEHRHALHEQGMAETYQPPAKGPSGN